MISIYTVYLKNVPKAILHSIIENYLIYKHIF